MLPPDADAAEALALLDELDQAPPLQPRMPPWGADLRAVPELPVKFKQAEALASIPGQSIKHRLIRVNTTDNPAVLWALHVALDAAGIPPCVRPEQSIGTGQARFITVLADLLWIAKRYPGHQPLLRRMRNVLNGEPDSLQWHRAALWAYQHCRGEPWALARRLALTDAQRQRTATMPALAQANRRRDLPARLEEIREKLLTHALDHPDGTGKVKPDDLADKRVRLLRLYLLLDRDRKALHEYLQRVDGVTTSLRATTYQLDAIARIAGARQLVHGPVRRAADGSLRTPRVRDALGRPPSQREKPPSSDSSIERCSGGHQKQRSGSPRAAKSWRPPAAAGAGAPPAPQAHPGVQMHNAYPRVANPKGC